MAGEGVLTNLWAIGRIRWKGRFKVYTSHRARRHSTPMMSGHRTNSIQRCFTICFASADTSVRGSNGLSCNSARFLARSAVLVLWRPPGWPGWQIGRALRAR